MLGCVALPALIFRSLAQLNLQTVNLQIVGAALLGKLVVALASCVVGYLSRDASAYGDAWSRAGAIALYATNSDDIGLGVPFFVALFPPAHAQMLFILAAAQALLIAPLCFVLLDVGDALRREAQISIGDSALGASHLGAASHGINRPNTASSSHPTISLRKIVCDTTRKLLANRLVLSAVCGLLWSQLIGNTLPWYVDKPTKLLGQAFGPLILILGGMSLVGCPALDSLSAMAMPTAIVALKV
jgi:predicted permease